MWIQSMIMKQSIALFSSDIIIYDESRNLWLVSPNQINTMILPIR